MKTTRFIARSGFLAREIAGEYMLVPINTGKIYAMSDIDIDPDSSDANGNVLDANRECLVDEFNGMVQLDEVGLFIWEQLSEPKTGAELIELVEKEFDTQGKDITDDIAEFIETGFKNHIIFILKDEE